jgi:hypothetical protein
MSLARETYRDSWPSEQKRVFHKGYPPLGKIFDTKYWEKYYSAFYAWIATIEKMEEIWVPTIDEKWKIGQGKIEIIKPKYFSTFEIDSIVLNSTYLKDDWREDLAAFYKTHYQKTSNSEKLLLLFLISYKNTSQTVLDESMFGWPVAWLTELIN